MPYCTKCGAEMKEEDAFCPSCGCPKGAGTAVAAAPASKEEGLTAIETVAFVFMILGTVFAAMVFLIPLAWCIPMTIHAKKAMDEKRKIDVGFKVCTLLFVSIVAGILLLCRDEKDCH